MFLFLRTLPLTIILLSTIPLSISLKCFHCNSLTHANCLSSDHYLSIPYSECSYEDAACFRTDTFVKYQGKYKLTNQSQ